MLKKTIEYVDFDGNTRKEDFYFNLSTAEMLQLQLGTDGGYDSLLARLTEAQDVPSLVKELDKLIRVSYGEKSPDGKRFIKSAELSEAFTQTEAYSQLFVELASSSTACAEFANGIMPADLANKVASIELNGNAMSASELKAAVTSAASN